MSYKIGVFGSAIYESDKILWKAEQLGSLLAQKQCALITGACSGLPYAAARSAYKHGACIYGYSPVANLDEQIQFTPNDDVSIYEKIFYIPETFELKDNRLACIKYRNVLSTAYCDAGIIISGRWGTLNEFTNLFDMGKCIGVLTATSGIANELPNLTQKIHKKTASKIIFEDEPQALVEKIIAIMDERVG